MPWSTENSSVTDFVMANDVSLVPTDFLGTGNDSETVFIDWAMYKAQAGDGVPLELVGFVHAVRDDLDNESEMSRVILKFCMPGRYPWPSGSAAAEMAERMNSLLNSEDNELAAVNQLLGDFSKEATDWLLNEYIPEFSKDVESLRHSLLENQWGDETSSDTIDETSSDTITEFANLESEEGDEEVEFEDDELVPQQPNQVGDAPKRKGRISLDEEEEDDDDDETDDVLNPVIDQAVLDDWNQRALKALGEGDSTNFHQREDIVLIEHPTESGNQPYLTWISDYDTGAHGRITMVKKGGVFDPGSIRVAGARPGWTSAIEAAVARVSKKKVRFS